MENNKSEMFFIIIIILNTIFLMLKWNGSDPIVGIIQRTSNVIFVSIFLVELILKLIAYDVKYFHYNWNIFDFVIILLSVI